MLKDLLEVLQVTFPNTHSLRVLWQLCPDGFQAKGLKWQQFDGEQGEFIHALIRVDDNAATFRFPVDQKGNPMQRPSFVDLQALNEHADRFYWEASGCMSFVLEMDEEEWIEQ